jgi:hypothetical protein
VCVLWVMAVQEGEGGQGGGVGQTMRNVVVVMVKWNQGGRGFKAMRAVVLLLCLR